MAKMNEYERITAIALRRPTAAFCSGDEIAGQWRELNYHAAPDYEVAVAQYTAFEKLLRDRGCEIALLDDFAGSTLDSIYVRDSLIVTPAGLVEAAMGKPQRGREPGANAAQLQKKGETVIGAIKAPGRVEGGDLVWLDDTTLVAGLGYRTNEAGIDQLRAVLGDDIAVATFDLPHFKGPGDVFHLMSVLSPVDENLAVVYLPLMPVRLVQFLNERNIGFIEVPDDEFATMACNVLAIAPRHVVVVEGNPKTQKLLQDAGCRVEVLAASEICRKGEGGPTCLTRPLRREK